MSSQLIDAFDLNWSASPDGNWSSVIQNGPANIDANGRQMVVTAAGRAEAEPLPYVAHAFDPPLDLHPYTELRVWLNSTLSGDGRRSGPVYLSLTIMDDPDAPTLTWERLIPVAKAATWELHRFWLEDMPEVLRQAAGGIRIQGLSPVPAFTLSIACMTAVAPQPIIDIDSAWLSELDNRFQVLVDGVTTDVSALIDLPEKPVARTAPYISIVPWSIRPGRLETQQSELIDNNPR